MSKTATETRSVVAKRTSGKSATAAAKAAKPLKTAPKSRKAAKPVLLAGGNPKIARRVGSASVLKRTL